MILEAGCIRKSSLPRQIFLARILGSAGGGGRAES